MTVTTSPQFASSIHGAADWREAAKKVLDDLTDIQTEGGAFTLGFLYITDHLASDVGNILGLFQSVLKIENWVGCVGIGVTGSDKTRIDQPAIAAMIGRLDPDDYHLINPKNKTDNTLKAWLAANDPMLVLTHEHPEEEPHIIKDLQNLEQATSGFLVGGVSLCRPQFFPKAASGDTTPDIFNNGVNMVGGHACVAFTDRIPVAVSISQGCTPIGEQHTITKTHDRTMLQLDGLEAQTIFENDLRTMAIEKIGQDPHQIMVEGGQMPEEFRKVFTGEMLAGFPLAQTDNGEMAVRNILGINEDGSMMVDYHPHTNQSVTFLHRDDQTLQADLSRKILDLRKRIEQTHGPITSTTIKGGLYISCAARAFTEEGEPNDVERQIITEILGEFPLCGFYAGGEIKGTNLYGFTGILTVFL